MKYLYLFSFVCIAIIFSGCGTQRALKLDTDGDGISNVNDECPDVAGLPTLNGCPDKDGDGIADNYDSCPDVAGPEKLQGCPDLDGDGVPDHLDKCPYVPGPAENAGCPWADSDGDNVPDKDDMCPDEAGRAEDHGCPGPKGSSNGYGLKEFPVNPPEPSDNENVPKSYFSKAHTIGDVNVKLVEALNKNGYPAGRYFYVKDGFAVVTRLEQTNKDGIPLSGQNRWIEQIAPDEDFSLSNYLSALFTARPGYYRCIVFIINKAPITYSGKVAGDAQVKGWMSMGATSLPEEIGNQPFTPQHKVTALIYQFKKPESSNDATLILPTPIPGKHLTAAGIKKALKP